MDQQAQHEGAEGQPSLPSFPSGEERMRLTDQERLFAGLIKAAVRDIPEVEPLSDFMYAHYAIVALLHGEASAQAILDRIQNLQHFKEEHRVLDTLEDAKQIVSRSVEINPGYAAYLFDGSADLGFLPPPSTFYTPHRPPTLYIQA